MERKPFPDLPKRGEQVTGEDFQWAMGLKLETMNGIGRWVAPYASGDPNADMEPRLICSIHGGNTMDYSKLEGPCWSRVPQWDLYCKEKMQL